MDTTEAPEQADSVPSVVEEFFGAPLRNLLRNERLELIIDRATRAPGKSFPEIFALRKEREGFYRFVEGRGYGLAEILEPHHQRTCARAADEDMVIAAHDTTEFELPGDAPREGLGLLRGKKQGFLSHVSLAISARTQRPLGVVAQRTWTRTGPVRKRRNGRRKTGADYARDVDKESERWLEAVQEVDLRLACATIHVMDREGDSYPLLAPMVQDNIRFVTRLARDRVASAEVVAGARDRVSALLPLCEVLAEREVPLSRRKAESAPAARRFSMRQGRIARLSIRSMPIVLARPEYSDRSLPAYLPVNLVHVVEVEPPDGEDPVEWKLVTTEPIATAEQALAVVDYYRARWIIEEYFKALKVGCAIEKRQLESYHALCNALAIFIPIAWKLLELRTLARIAPETPATEVLTAVQLQVLQACSPREVPAAPSVREALLAVAALGGHIRNNGEPGWQVLGRGFERLLTLEVGWTAAVAAATVRRKGDQS